MNRIIKFRAWDRVAKVMSPEFVLFGEFTLIGGVHAWQHEIRETPHDDSLLMLNDLNIMQFTGLHDKNGREIYEFDILKMSEDTKTGMKLYYMVEWGHHAWSIRHYLFKRIHTITSNYIWAKSEVIGNIYENPDLLK